MRELQQITEKLRLNKLLQVQATANVSVSEVECDDMKLYLKPVISDCTFSYPALTKSKQPRYVRVVRKYKAGDL